MYLFGHGTTERIQFRSNGFHRSLVLNTQEDKESKVCEKGGARWRQACDGRIRGGFYPMRQQREDFHAQNVQQTGHQNQSPHPTPTTPQPIMANDHTWRCSAARSLRRFLRLWRECLRLSCAPYAGDVPACTWSYNERSISVRDATDIAPQRWPSPVYHRQAAHPHAAPCSQKVRAERDAHKQSTQRIPPHVSVGRQGGDRGRER